MKKSGIYAVRVSGLSDGKHTFSYDLDQEFFALFEQAEIEHGGVSARVILEKETGVMVLHFHLEGEVEVICDRCLDPFMMKISSDQRLVVKRGDIPGVIEDDVIVIGNEDHEIDVRHFLYEFVVLALPCKKVHPVDENGLSGCNPAMIEKLEAYQEKDDHREGGTDPRWNALKEIIGKNN